MPGQTACFSDRGRVSIAGGVLALAWAIGVPARSAPPAAIRAPATIYSHTCGYCHGQHVGPVIRGRNLPADYVMQMVRNGPAAMPAFRPTEISDDELKALARWIQQSKSDPKEHDK